MYPMIRLLTLVLVLFTGVARAAEDYGNVEFLNGWQLPDGSYQAAIAFNLNDGWKTYWRVPGPAGLPTVFNWRGSDNIDNIKIDWPSPHVFESFGLYSFGYKGRIILPVRITPIDKSVPVRIDLNLGFGVCSDICMPADERLQASIGAASPEQGKADIKAALAIAAKPAADIGLQSVRCRFTPNAQGLDIRADMTFSKAPTAQQYVVMEYDNSDIWIDVAKLSGNGRDVVADTTLEFYGEGMLSLDRSKLRLTVLQNNQSYELTGCPAS